MIEDLSVRASALIEELNLARAVDIRGVRLLAGGVASDIAVATLPGPREVCVKFALPRLKVDQEWLAPVHRNRAEYAWLGAAAVLAPGTGPTLLGRSERLHGFAMEYVAGPGVTLWKSSLLQGSPERGEAAAVGEAVGRVHAGSTRPDFDREPFANRDDFHALRIEPYLLATVARHPEMAERLHALAEALYAADAALIHGDVSPKNVLFRQGRPILLDAECATMGDPAFDVAFCLNHLVLKGLHRAEAAAERRRGAQALWMAYAPHVAWEPPDGLEARVAGLVPALMLARVDGKSPVEYLTEEGRVRVRGLALGLLAEPPATLAALLDRALPEGKP